MNKDDKTMLALAALTYRGFGLHSEAAIEDRLRPWLPRLEQEDLGIWDLVWGPATFRAPTSLFDDAMMYVAQERGTKRYAIAVRGTNPLSVFDWVFGDFWVQLQIDQPPATDPQARLSASTALGMAILQGLAAERPSSSSSAMAPVAGALTRALPVFAPRLPEIDPFLLLTKPSSLTDVDLQARVAALTGTAGEALRTSVLHRLSSVFDGAVAASERHVYNLLIREIGKAKDRGQSLLDFLRTVGNDAELAVTGHSKGGALAIAAAYWLHQALPSLAPRISCFSFAGPTAGNVAFARRYDQLLGSRTRRIVNRRDVVPHAWAPAELKRLRAEYPALSPALTALAGSVKQLAYTHVRGELVEIPLQSRADVLVQDIIRQHLDAYLEAASFKGGGWSATGLFLGA